MTEDITARAVELAFEVRSPTTLRAIPDPSADAKTIYQQFAFLKSLLDAKAFKDALHYITTRPHERLDRELSHKDLRRGFKPSGRALRELARGENRFPLPSAHPLRRLAASLPNSTIAHSSRRTEDTPENRFVRFALETFLHFLGSLMERLKHSGSEEHSKLISQAKALSIELEQALTTSALANASRMLRVPIESPVLQRKEGYREVLQAWLKFDMAARLVWEGGADVYELGRRDVATLYEYWVFFELLGIFSEHFGVDTNVADELIEETGDHLGLRLKVGRNVVLRGQVMIGATRVNGRLDYNRTFVRRLPVGDASSWTERMRPDYTLSLWAGEDGEAAAEIDGSMVHVHFDAKYRIEALDQLFGRDDEALTEEQRQRALDEEELQQAAGTYKRVDLLKMHAYKDAIRRSYGAYILYPGDVGRLWTGFHELLPGVGAFVLRPGTEHSELSKFVGDLVRHVGNPSKRHDVAIYVSATYAGTSGTIK